MDTYCDVFPLLAYVMMLPTHLVELSYTTCSVAASDTVRPAWSAVAFRIVTRSVVPLVHQAFALLGPRDCGQMEPAMKTAPGGTKKTCNAPLNVHSDVAPCTRL